MDPLEASKADKVNQENKRVKGMFSYRRQELTKNVNNRKQLQTNTGRAIISDGLHRK